ncbi:MAG: hypothetical protein EZS28_002623 [Streblomastix strix]|uniref:Uncharacterized protein n=1 Tax=Streblomastix strix TaxID=222440 RepID=A0A5J4X523_9EUKA|nr:MAG: hypothetical protein EZS28_002623 [Streblomastix strix]
MMEFQPTTQIKTSTQTLVRTIGNVNNSIIPPAPPSTTYHISLVTKRKTLTGVLSFRDIRISTDSTEILGINDEVGIQFSWML